MLFISSMVLSVFSTMEPKCTGAFKTFIGPLLVLGLLGLNIFNNSLQIFLKTEDTEKILRVCHVLPYVFFSFILWSFLEYLTNSFVDLLTIFKFISPILQNSLNLRIKYLLNYSILLLPSTYCFKSSSIEGNWVFIYSLHVPILKTLNF